MKYVGKGELGRTVVDKPSAPISPEKVELLDEVIIGDLLKLQSPERPGFLRSILSGFIERGPGRLADLRKGIDATEWDAVKNVAHAMKGVSGTVGAKRLSVLAEHLEDAVGDPSRVQTLLDNLDEAWQQTVGAMQQLLEEQEPAQQRGEPQA